MSSLPNSIARTPRTPYYAVIFTSQRTENDRPTDIWPIEWLSRRDSSLDFLVWKACVGTESFGITVSYWSNEEAIAAWKAHEEHKPAQEGGKRAWYADYQIRVARVERSYGEMHLA